jgi:nicotinamidase-related amidase
VDKKILPALLVVDMQNDFFTKQFTDPGHSREACRRITRGVNEIAPLFRQAGYPVIFIKMIYKKNKSNWTLRMKDLDAPICIEGTPGSELVPGLIPEPGDHVILKTRHSPFHKTKLPALLKQLKIGALVITGINSHACVRGAIIDGFNLNYRIFYLPRLIDSYAPERHQESLNYFFNRLGKDLSPADLKKRLKTGDFDFRFTAQPE